MEIQQYRRKLDLLLAELSHAERSAQEEERTLTSCRSRVEDVGKTQTLIQSVSQYCQEQANKRMASIVTRCIQSVFGEDSYTFKIRFESKRGKTEAVLVFERDGMELDDPIEETGGGVIDLAAFALRLASLTLIRPRKRMFLGLDEPAKHLSENYRPAFRELLEVLAEELNLQILMITHSEELVVGKIIQL